MSKQTKQITDQPSKAAAKNYSSLFSIVLFILVLIVVFAGGGWLTYHNQQQQRLLSTLQQQLQNNNVALQTLQQQTKISLNQIDHQLQTLNQQRDNNQLWVLTNAAQLTRLAIYYLTIEKNTVTSTALLTTADKRIAMLNEPSFINIRNALADNIAKLKAVPAIDTDSLIAQLIALSNQVTRLPFLITQSSATTSQTAPLNKGTVWQKTWRQLQKIFIIRHASKNFMPIVSADQQVLLRQHMMALLSQVQWAILHRQQKIYLASLQQAQQLIKQHFSQQQPTTTAVLNTLQTLKHMNIAPTMPDISSALHAIEKAQ
ncbi:MAG: uroporphyrinogen-III C-methyltransferase [Gammaproteobacteria bacterium]|nr:uroporphyrinogen-III C-methyltransferase [Gammaproteobacteria bacterium]